MNNHAIQLSLLALIILRGWDVTDAFGVTRRELMKKTMADAFGIVGGLTVATATLADPALAASPSSSQIKNDEEKIVKGFKRLNYLLDNWEKETTICKRNDNPYQGCDRTPEKVMEYLGFKSMEDPLFRADKTMIRLQALVPDDQSSRYQDAIDTWMEKAEEGNGMAFISSWGEANPGGGRDRVELFIERSRKDVVEARDTLKTVIDVLGLKVE